MIQELVSHHKTVIVKTPDFDLNSKIERARPLSFFRGINESNKFYDNLIIVKIELEMFSEKSYDGVHYSSVGNDIIFAKLKRFL